MKKLTKIAAVLLAVIMVLGMTTVAFAADKTSITISESGNYNAFKLMDATETGNGKYAYTINTKYRTVLQSVTSKTSDTDIYDYISALSGDSVKAFAKSVYAAIKTATLAADASVEEGTSLSNIDQGYWLIADVGEKADTYDAVSLVMLDTAGQEGINVSVKKDVPTLTKKIVEGNVEKDVTDVNIGDTVNYKLTGTVPSNIGDYESYKYTFTDTMTNLEYTADSATVLVGSNDCTEGFTVTFSNGVLTVSCDDILALEGVTVTAETTVTVTYDAVLQNTAVIGSTGNPNTAYLSFSNEPDNGKTGTMGKTPDDTTIVYTYGILATKIDADSKDPLKGAKFVLYRINASETKEYAVVTDNKVASWTTTEASATVLESDDNGKISVNGLDVGTYFLKETNPPMSYNKLADPIEIAITASYTTAGAIDSFAATVGGEDATANSQTGIVSFDVENSSGSELPSTGGIGTYIFYIVGALLVVSAVAYFIIRKRTSVTAEK